MPRKKTLTEKIKEEKNKLTLLEWCDKQVEDGHELKLLWDGGNDSGWCHFEIDGSDVENEYTRKLVDYMYDELDYGSWAGEFTASGEAIYSSETKTFEGTDEYSESANDSTDVNIEIVIPKHLWFSQLGIHMECNYDESPDVDIKFGIKNGFLTDEHSEIEEALKIDISDRIVAAIDDWQDHTGEEVERSWYEETILPTDFTVDGDKLIYNIGSIEITYPQNHPKMICLDVIEIQEKINEQNEN